MRYANTKPDSPPDQPHYVAGPQYSVECVTSLEELPRLRQDWNRLSRTAGLPNVFMTYDWFQTWNQRRAQEHRKGVRRPHVLVLKRDEAVAGVVPLIYRASPRFGFQVRRLESLASPADYNDLVMGDDPAGQIEAIVDFLAATKNHWDLIDLQSLREIGDIRTRLESALSRANLPYRVVPQEHCSYLPIEANWPELIRKLSQSERREGMGLRTLRNKQHRLERMRAEGLRVRIIENPQDEPALLEELIAIEKQEYIGQEMMGRFVGRFRGEFQCLFDTLGPQGWLFVALMELRSRPIAWLMGFRCGRKLWYYQGAYDHSFSRLSPGTMLFLAVLDYGFSHGYQEYDFLTGDEPYKKVWSVDCHKTFRLQIWSKPWIKQTYLAWGTVYRWFGSRK